MKAEPTRSKKQIGGPVVTSKVATPTRGEGPVDKRTGIHA